MIIGVCGLIGAGKDTIADYLVNVHGFRRDSFAASLKDAVAAIFGWDRDMIESQIAHENHTKIDFATLGHRSAEESFPRRNLDSQS
jgi:cytidylate kinase